MFTELVKLMMVPQVYMLKIYFHASFVALQGKIMEIGGFIVYMLGSIHISGDTKFGFFLPLPPLS